MSSFAQRFNGRHYVTLRNLYSISGLSILLHDVLSLLDATSCDKPKLQKKELFEVSHLHMLPFNIAYTMGHAAFGAI